MKNFISRIFSLKQNNSPIVNKVDYSENGKFKVIKFERKSCKLLFEGQKSYDTEKYIVEMLVNTDELIVANKEIAILRPQIHGTGILKFFLPFDCKLENIHITENTQIKENDVLFSVTPINNVDTFQENLLKQNQEKLNKTEINYTLDDFSKEYKITSPNWHLLTGKKEKIYELARKSYFAEENIGFSKDTTDFLHTEHILLVDKNKKIRGIYNATLELEIQQLIKDISTLKKE